MAIPTIVAISRSAITGDELAFDEFKDKKNDIDRGSCLIKHDPAVKGVHPGESVFIYALDFNITSGSPTFVVHPVGLALASELEIIEQKSIFSDSIHDYVQIEVRMPTLDELQASSDYDRNALVMLLQFQIETPPNQKSLESIPIPILVASPWPVPAIVAISRSAIMDNDEAYNEFKSENNDIGRAIDLIKHDPAALGVYPGESVYIYALDIGTNLEIERLKVHLVQPQYTFDEIATETKREVIFSDNFHTYVQIKVPVPTLDRLQLSDNYEKNALMMGLQFQIEKPSTGGKSWNSLPILVWMPWPKVKVWDFDPVLGKIKVGTSDPPIGYFGRPSDSQSDPVRGQVRWYPVKELEIPKLPPAPDFINLKKAFGPDGKLVVVLPPEIQTVLYEIREEGTYIPHDRWTDSYVEFTMPEDLVDRTDPIKPVFKPGVVILWRDALPSRLIMDVQELINQLWRANVNIPMAEDGISYPVPLGEPIRLGVNYLLDAANNLLADLLKEGEIQVKFGWEALPYKNNDFKWRDLIVDGGPAESLTGGADPNASKGYKLDAELKLRVPPRVILEDPDKATLEACGAFCIQLKVYIEGELFGKPLNKTFNVGVPLIFRPTPLVLPTMAIFFEHINFEGAPLVMFPKGMFSKLGLKDLKVLEALAKLDGIHFDDNSSDAGLATTIKSQTTRLLNIVQLGLQMLNTFDKDIPYIDAIIDVIGRLSAATRLVFNSEGEITDLRGAVFDRHKIIMKNRCFCGSISSVILVGVPYKWSKIVVNCYEDVKKGGRKLELGLPGEHYVAAVADMRVMGDAYPLFGFNVALPYVKGPSGFPPPDQFGNKIDEFNDKIASIEIVAQ